ncbi:MAG: hypothetical protein NTU95_02680 [Methanothrix sp.]|nr:hypothetical protein [Methanothrix sp.]
MTCRASCSRIYSQPHARPGLLTRAWAAFRPGGPRSAGGSRSPCDKVAGGQVSSLALSVPLMRSLCSFKPFLATDPGTLQNLLQKIYADITAMWIRNACVY